MTQEDAILSHLEDKKNITSLEAFKLYGATRLSAIIYNLRHKGFNIKSEYETTKNRYGTTTTYVKYIFKGKK